MRNNYMIDSIMSEYNRKKRNKERLRRQELDNFIKENCIKCKNRKTQLCHIVRDIENELSCPYKNI